MADSAECDVAVIGAGIGGIYAVHRFTELGLSVVGVEGAHGVGGVWHHNRYPGARVDVDSIDYCYHFSPELWREWQWSERFATQGELLGYLNFAADRLDVRRHFLFDTWLAGARWSAARRRWRLTTSTGTAISAQFLVMCTGQLSATRRPPFALDRFRGEVVETSHWPDRDVPLAGRRIGVVGTGSTAVQCIPPLAERAERLYVFQRTANYSLPARNAPADGGVQREIGGRLAQVRERLLAHPGGALSLGRPDRPASAYDQAGQRALLEDLWRRGGHQIDAAFSDQATNASASAIVSDFLRERIREIVKDPELAEKLVPDYPAGTRRTALDTGYYETYNRDNVTLVDIRDDPIVEVTETGVRTESAHYEVDLLVLALGFVAFSGALDRADIRNELGHAVTDGWKRGPRTVLGLMTTGFPNFFTPTGPGGPSTLINMAVNNEFCIDWTAQAIAYVKANGYDSIEPSRELQDAWTRHVAEASEKLLRRQADNYMVHVNDDGSRVFMPYAGGLQNFVRHARDMAANDFAGFLFH